MKLFKYFILLTACLLIFSCGEQEGGLFYSIELESEIGDGDLSNDITVGEMFRSNDYYFIAAGKFLYRSAEDSAVWPDEEVNYTPEGYENYLCFNMLLVDNNIYAVFYDRDTGDYKLFTADTATAAGTEGLVWSEPVSLDGLAETEPVVKFESCEGAVFIFTKTSDTTYNLYAAVNTAASPFDAATGRTPIASSINTGELRADFDGINYWIVAGNKVYRTASDFTGITDITSELTSKSKFLQGDGFSGVVCADTDDEAGTEVYISSKEGVMMKYILVDSSMTWKTLDLPEVTDGLYNSLKDLKRITIADRNIDIILAGSTSGYYEMQAGSTTDEKSFISAEETDSTLTTYIQFDSIDLSNKIINTFYLDDSVSSKEKVFALGYNGGLWKNSLDSDKYWEAE